MKSKVSILCIICAIVIAGGVYTIHAPDEQHTETAPVAAVPTKVTENSGEILPEKIVEKTEEPKKTETVHTGTLNFNVDPLSEKYAGYDSSNHGWGFKKEKNKAPSFSESITRLFSETDTYCIGKSDEKILYLTFDEGYENGYTSVILDVLKEKNVPAAFFITGPYLNRQGDLVDRMVNEGHVVGNHTVNHPNLAKSDLQTVYKELKELDEKFFGKYGKSMIFMRPPEGEYSEKMLRFVSDMGYKTMLWSFAYKDWDVNIQKGADYAFEQVTPYLHNGAVLLLHAVSSDNAGALGRIIDYAKEQGFEFRSLEEIIQ